MCTYTMCVNYNPGILTTNKAPYRNSILPKVFPFIVSTTYILVLVPFVDPKILKYKDTSFPLLTIRTGTSIPSHLYTFVHKDFKIVKINKTFDKVDAFKLPI